MLVRVLINWWICVEALIWLHQFLFSCTIRRILRREDGRAGRRRRVARTSRAGGEEGEDRNEPPSAGDVSLAPMELNLKLQEINPKVASRPPPSWGPSSWPSSAITGCNVHKEGSSSVNPPPFVQRWSFSPSRQFSFFRCLTQVWLFRFSLQLWTAVSFNWTFNFECWCEMFVGFCCCFFFVFVVVFFTFNLVVP